MLISWLVVVGCLVGLLVGCLSGVVVVPSNMPRRCLLDSGVTMRPIRQSQRSYFLEGAGV